MLDKSFESINTTHKKPLILQLSGIGYYNRTIGKERCLWTHGPLLALAHPDFLFSWQVFKHRDCCMGNTTGATWEQEL